MQQPQSFINQKAIENAEQKNMVGWYDPLQLLKTGNEVAISTIIGAHADRRLVEGLASENRPYDYRAAVNEKKEFWLDYVSDVGDGWNSTYAVAHHLAQEKLTLRVHGEDQDLPRGKVLIMGGDEVYPTADRVEYANRLEYPYAAAMMKNTSPSPHLFAIPGNHDWYDSLASFSNIFFDKDFFPLFERDRLCPTEQASDQAPPDKTSGLWRIPQERSYFALRLPYNYWLIGIDVQLDHDLDTEQIEYFKRLSGVSRLPSGADAINTTKTIGVEAGVDEVQMQPGDKIILCCAEPFWVYAEMYKNINPIYKNTRLGSGYLEKQIFPRQDIVAYVAGDLHHYYALFGKEYDEVKDADKNVVRITAGGGGAFLHPTHGELEKAFSHYPDLGAADANLATSQWKKSFPTSQESRRLGWQNVTFLWRNKWFGGLTGLIYFLAAWSVLAFFSNAHIEMLEQKNSFSVWLGLISWSTLFVALKTPIAALWALGILGGFYLFTDTHSHEYRKWAGWLHGLTHVLACLIISWFGHYAVTQSLLREKLAFFINHYGVIFVTITLTMIGAFLLAIYSRALWLAFSAWRGCDNFENSDEPPSLSQRLQTWLPQVVLFLMFCAVVYWLLQFAPLQKGIDTLLGQSQVRILNLLISAVIIFILSWIVSSVIMGMYLLVSLNVFGRHSNEAFSSLAVQDYKNFLRLKIDENALTIYPIKIVRVPRKWRKSGVADKTVSAYVADDRAASLPTLIQAPIVIPHNLYPTHIQ